MKTFMHFVLAAFLVLSFALVGCQSAAPVADDVDTEEATEEVVADEEEAADEDAEEEVGEEAAE